MSVAAHAEINAQSSERQNNASKPKDQNVTNPVSSHTGAGFIGGLYDHAVTLLAGSHPSSALNVPRGPRRG
jgi:hypothetical protein